MSREGASLNLPGEPGAKSLPRPRVGGKGKFSFVFQLLLAIVFLLGLWLSFSGTVLDRPRESTAPEHWGTLRLVSRAEGPEALAQISRLHGSDLDLVSAYVAHYANERERVMVWVGKAENGSQATALTRKMAQALGKGGTGFGSAQPLTIDGREVFQVEGPGGKHFFYSSQERVVWLSVEVGNARALLEQAINIF